MDDTAPSSISCPACGESNVSEAEVCSRCGEPLSPVERVFGHGATPAHPRWLDHARGRARSLKDEGSKASEVRMQAFVDIDRRREARQAEAAARQHRRDRLLLRAVALAFAGFLVIVAIVSLLRLI